MNPAFVTTTLLLSRLHDSTDAEAWRAFDGRFRGVVIAAAKKLGLSDADAEDAAQETLLQAVRDYQAGRYDRTKGRLSSWMVSIAHHRICDQLRKRRRPAAGKPPLRAADEPAAHEVAAAIELALERRICEESWQRIRDAGQGEERTIRAFELTVLRGVPVAEAAEQCGMTVDQVYVSKHRVAKRLQAAADEIGCAMRDGW